MVCLLGRLQRGHVLLAHVFGGLGAVALISNMVVPSEGKGDTVPQIIAR